MRASSPIFSIPRILGYLAGRKHSWDPNPFEIPNMTIRPGQSIPIETADDGTVSFFCPRCYHRVNMKRSDEGVACRKCLAVFFPNHDEKILEYDDSLPYDEPYSEVLDATNSQAASLLVEGGDYRLVKVDYWNDRHIVWKHGKSGHEWKKIANIKMPRSRRLYYRWLSYSATDREGYWTGGFAFLIVLIINVLIFLFIISVLVKSCSSAAGA